MPARFVLVHLTCVVVVGVLVMVLVLVLVLVAMVEAVDMRRELVVYCEVEIGSDLEPQQPEQERARGPAAAVAPLLVA